jgi:hypothetical protein
MGTSAACSHHKPTGGPYQEVSTTRLIAICCWPIKRNRDSMEGAAAMLPAPKSPTCACATASLVCGRTPSSAATMMMATSVTCSRQGQSRDVVRQQPGARARWMTCGKSRVGAALDQHCRCRFHNLCAVQSSTSAWSRPLVSVTTTQAEACPEVDQHMQVRSYLCSTCTHGAERLVPRSVQEADGLELTVHLHLGVVGTNTLQETHA